MPYVYANVKVKYGQLPAFFEQMVTIKRVMEENGWKSFLTLAARRLPSVRITGQGAVAQYACD